MFPVKLLYTVEPVQDYIDTAILTIFQIHTDPKNAQGGDILVFLTGQEEIEAVQKTLEEFGPQCPSGSPKMIVCPIFASFRPINKCPFSNRPLRDVAKLFLPLISPKLRLQFRY